jgi:hypothetical protein
MSSAYFMVPSLGVWVRLYDERAGSEGTATRNNGNHLPFEPQAAWQVVSCSSGTHSLQGVSETCRSLRFVWPGS